MGNYFLNVESCYAFTSNSSQQIQQDTCLGNWFAAQSQGLLSYHNITKSPVNIFHIPRDLERRDSGTIVRQTTHHLYVIPVWKCNISFLVV